MPGRVDRDADDDKQKDIHKERDGDRTPLRENDNIRDRFDPDDDDDD